MKRMWSLYFAIELHMIHAVHCTTRKLKTYGHTVLFFHDKQLNKYNYKTFQHVIGF